MGLSDDVPDAKEFLENGSCLCWACWFWYIECTKEIMAGCKAKGAFCCFQGCGCGAGWNPGRAA